MRSHFEKDLTEINLQVLALKWHRFVLEMHFWHDIVIYSYQMYLSSNGLRE